jgi:peptide/nickel transport system ATP-binding protein
MADAEKLLEIKDLKTYFFFDEGVVRAVDGVSLSLEKGKTLGVVGESGCGKSVTAQSILQIVGAGGRIVSGQILYNQHGSIVDLTKYKAGSEQMRQIRGRDISMIFQEPMTAFSPVYTVGKQIAEAITYHEPVTEKQARKRVIELLEKVGIPRAGERYDSYPFELSGGMRQRAMIAMALVGSPTILIADEPTTALDVTIQAQILDLLRALQSELGSAIMIITHNMGVIAEMADTVAVMYLGKVIEHAPVWQLFDHPAHPYTAALLRSIPMIEENVKDRLESIKGVVPDPYNLPSGCRFHPRCDRYVDGLCNQVEPQPVEVSPGHYASCLLLGGAHG